MNNLQGESMQIETQEAIAVMLQQIQEPRQKRPVAMSSAHPRTRAAGRCACRQCKVCQDNARWDRVFNEKFVDPDYYLPRHITQGSSLASL